ncbi:MAG: hypothetical protein WAO98_10050 [Alphaproteobacteria bacterium]
MLSHDQILSNVRQAFSPLYCDAQIWDYSSRLEFKVSDYNRNIVRSGEMALHYAQDPELLTSVLRQFRERIQSKGFVLNRSE